MRQKKAPTAHGRHFARGSPDDRERIEDIQPLGDEIIKSIIVRKENQP